MVSVRPSSFTSREQFALLPFSTISALATCSRAEILTFNALALHADAETGHCWPGRARLAEITNLNESRISKATTGLERKGLIRKSGAPGFRVDYYLLPQTPLPVSESTPDRNGTTPLIETAHRTDQGTDQKPERAPEPEPARPEPARPEPTNVPPNGTHSDFAAQHEPAPPKAPVISLPSKTSLPDDWPLPDDYRAWAEQNRPDLTDRLDAIASNFADYHASKATRSASWIAEWRRWVHRERAVKPPQNADKAMNTPSRYAHHDQPEKPLSAAVRAALEVGERNRIAMLIQNGIDPITGFKSAPPPAATTLPDGDPLPAGRNESPEDYDRRFEQHRQFQLRKFQEMMEARSAKEGGGGR